MLDQFVSGGNPAGPALAAFVQTKLIHRWRVDTEQTQAATEQCPHARLGQTRPVLGKSARGDGAAGAKQESLHERQRLDLLQVFDFDLLLEGRDIDDNGGAEEGVEGELV